MMDFSAPSPSSSSDSRSSYSPRLMSSDLGLDPSDPLNLLLHNTSQSHSGNSSMEESSQEGGSPPDWSQLSSLWPDNDFGGQTKPYPDMIDFSELGSLSMDVDFSNAISVEPSALHFNPIKYNTMNTHYSYIPHAPAYADDLLSGHLPFTFQPNSPSDTSPQQSGRRLSITSSVSSSGASLSPAPELVPSPVTAKRLDFPPNSTPTPSNNAASELAERVRQSAGVMLALPMNAQIQAQENQQALHTAPTTSPTTAPKLPIPRLPRHVSLSVKSTSTVSSAASTPPPSTPSPSPTSSVPTSTAAPAVLPRPKTSHTTIERRYRTNLNARIQSLRMAVPALRVVEDRDGAGNGKKRAPNKVLVSSDPLNGDVVCANGVVDVIDERGFVDGVKVARKCSKANVLGKAVEYIRVLKKRETRLKTEQAGLKTLVAGLVGGPALLREWEREWREMFGGEEKDEVEGEMEGEADDDDSEEEEDDEEGGRKRKRGRTTAVGVTGAKQEKEKKIVQSVDGVVTEKRKRGRPRKVIPPVVPVPLVVHDRKIEPERQGAQQYLLATFALFSFFNSPLASPMGGTSAPHTHTGTVLNGTVASVQGGAAWGLTEYMQMFHLLVSVIVLLSFVSSWVGFSFSLGKSLRSGSLLNFIRGGGASKGKRTKGDWVRLSEECVLSASNEVPLFSRIQIYYQISSWHGASVQELITAALTMYGAGSVRILGGLARAKARAVWATAKSRSQAQSLAGANTYERIVLEEMTVDEAIEHLRGRSVHEEPTGEGEDKARTPMQLLAVSRVRERIRAHLGVLFVRSANSTASEDGGDPDKEAVERENAELQRTIEAAKELGGHVGELGRRLERVWKVPGDDAGCNPDVVSEEDEGDVEALLAALVLYRRVFAVAGHGVSALMSPPPSPRRKDTSDAGMLRRALGSRVFEESAVLEDARDRAVDMVVELERRSVGLR